MPHALHVLLVDASPDARERVTALTESGGHHVTWRKSADGALEVVSNESPDVVSVRSPMPDSDAVDFCRRVRVLTRNPIVVLSDGDPPERRVAVLDAGADSCVPLPVTSAELLAHVRVAGRHRRLLATVSDEQVLRCGLLWLDVGAHTAGVDRVELELTRKEFALLLTLLRNQGKVLAHRALLDLIWGPEQDIATLRTHVTHLRRKLTDAGADCGIQTAAGTGYSIAPSRRPGRTPTSSRSGRDVGPARRPDPHPQLDG